MLHLRTIHPLTFHWRVKYSCCVVMALTTLFIRFRIDGFSDIWAYKYIHIVCVKKAYIYVYISKYIHMDNNQLCSAYIYVQCHVRCTIKVRTHESFMCYVLRTYKLRTRVSKKLFNLYNCLESLWKQFPVMKKGLVYRRYKKEMECTLVLTITICSHVHT